MSTRFDEQTIIEAASQGLADDEIPSFDGVALPPADRSSAELYAICPAQARFIETGRVMNVSHAINIGNEAHAALSAGIDEFFAADFNLRDYQIADAVADTVRGRLINSRPDVQPDVIDAMMRMVYPWSKFIVARSPDNILRYDGGRGSRSGQLGWNVPSLGVCATSEVDLLCAGPSPVLLHEYDWKSGRTPWTETTVSRSFQFTFHAVLVFENYPAIEALDVSVWVARSNEPTKPARFERKYLAEYQARVVSALAERAKWVGVAPEQAAAWPTVEKCPLCPARALCPGVPHSGIHADPVAFVLDMHAKQQQLEAMAEQAAAYVAATGRDIITPGDVRFGIDRPVAHKAPTPSLYSLGGGKVPTPKVAKSTRRRAAPAETTQAEPPRATVDAVMVAWSDRVKAASTLAELGTLVDELDKAGLTAAQMLTVSGWINVRWSQLKNQ